MRSAFDAAFGARVACAARVVVASGVLYVLGLVPMGWFWQRDARLRSAAPRRCRPALRAYFLGHLGKYVPGKAMSVILRVAAVRKWVPSMRIALVSTLIETLTMMAVGALLAAVMSAFVLRLGLYIVSLAAFGMAAVAVGCRRCRPSRGCSPPRLIARDKHRNLVTAADSTRATARCRRQSSRHSTISLLGDGLVRGRVCWMLLALSLWATLRADRRR